MKYLIVLACLLVVAFGELPPEIKEKIKANILKYGGECKGEVGATDDDIAVIRGRNPPTTHTAKCFVACMNKKFGVQNAAGKIDRDGAYAMIEKIKPLDADLYGKMKQVADTCSGQVTDDADECETAANMFNCVEKENKVVGMTPLDV